MIFNNTLKKVTLYLYKILNRYIFFSNGIKYGKNLCVHGTLPLKIAKNATVTIGDNFYMSSGLNLNPLSGNKRGYICCNEGANISIGDNVAMSSTVLWAHKSISIGNNVLCGGNVKIIDSDAHSLNYIDRRNKSIDYEKKIDESITIGNDVFIGMDCIILKGVTIGDRAIIGAGSVVSKSIPKDSIAYGNPIQIKPNSLSSKN